jgi:hypothetical protein
MLCRNCQRQLICLVYQLAQQDRKIQIKLAQMIRCEQKILAKIE